jgi:DNA-directed RNA polymerase specialized sigma24 family protein
MPSKDAGRGLTADAFANLLSRLGGDAEQAGAAYEHLRRALMGFFTWRGAATPEECADETLDRLAVRIDQGVAVQDVARFAHGIARLVLLEHWRRPEARGLPLDALEPTPQAPDEAPDDAASECLDRCLGELSAENRALILGYYAGDGRSRIDGRKRMARALGLTENALRNRTQRIRDELERCLGRCLAVQIDENTHRGV